MTAFQFSLEIIRKIVRKAPYCATGLKSSRLGLELFHKTSTIRLTYVAGLYLGIRGVKTHTRLSQSTQNRTQESKSHHR